MLTGHLCFLTNYDEKSHTPDLRQALDSADFCIKISPSSVYVNMHTCVCEGERERERGAVNMPASLLPVLSNSSACAFYPMVQNREGLGKPSSPSSFSHHF